MDIRSKPNGYIPIDGKGRMYLKKDIIQSLNVKEGDLVVYYIKDDWVMLHKTPSLDLVFPDTDNNQETPS